MLSPKDWGFTVALLPGFMSINYLTARQLVASLGVMLPSEFMSITLYAAGGGDLRRLLMTDALLAKLNKVAAALMVLAATLVLIKI